MKKTCVQVLAVLMLVVMCVTTFTACSSESSAMRDGFAPGGTYAATTATAMSYSAEKAYGVNDGVEVKTETPPEAGSSSLYDPGDSRKLILRADVSLETEDYDGSVAAINAQIVACGAYIENSNASGASSSRSRSLNLVIRVPAANFDAFMAQKDSFGVVQYSNVWQDDVTFNYMDMQTRLETLNTKRERLLVLLNEAKKMEDIIALENALSETIYEIESYTSTLKRLDNQISYCTVTLYLREVYKATVVQETPKTLGQRISQKFESTVAGLSDFGEDLLVFIIGASPVLLILAAIVVVIVLIIRRTSRRNRAKYLEFVQRKEAEKAAADTKKPEDKE
ncbi:MAG: DUF4349 domain-containing protein [Eubacteriales bacterium]|jgi:hypothetical protein